MTTLRHFLAAHRFLIAVSLAILIALILTVLSVSLYVQSGASRLDLSRPGYEAVRQQVDETKDDPFSATGPVDSSTLEQFQQLYTKRRTTLNTLNPFAGDVLSDDSVGLFSNGTNQ